MGRKLKVLTFDVECRPMAWYGGDFVTKQITAIAWSWRDNEIYVKTLAQDGTSLMLASFHEAYTEADVVTGHYIRGFDLPLIQSELLNAGISLLTKKETSDTKLDLLKAHGISKSMENLASMLGCTREKIPMTTTDWGLANALDPDATQRLILRVGSDVSLHQEMRAKMIEQGMLGPTKAWNPTTHSSAGGYVA